MCSFHKFVDLINFGQARQFWKNSDWLIELLQWIFFFEREDGSAYLGSIHYGSED